MTQRVALLAVFASMAGSVRQQSATTMKMLPQPKDLRFEFGTDTETITLRHRGRQVTFSMSELFDALGAPK